MCPPNSAFNLGIMTNALSLPRPPLKLRLAVFVVLTLAGNAALAAQQTAGPSTDPRYDVREVMIPMRDGVRLHTVIYTPKTAASPRPIIFRRTPYAVMGAAGSFRGSYKSFADANYAFAFQDIRGKYGSEGTFVMQRPPAHKWDSRAIDESTDAYDTIEWLVKNVPNNNGRVGMLGVSYDGWTTAMALIDPHPALKVASPQASPADMWIGDDFHHNGAFRLSYGFEYAAMMETAKESTQFAFDRFDTYDWYLSLGPLSNVNAMHLNGRIPTWNDYVAHPDWDEFWQRQTIVRYLTTPTVPTLNVAGFWDQEDFYGPIAIYDSLEKRDTNNLNHLIVGPWNHGGWNGNGASLGPIQFASNTGVHMREQILAPFFAYYLEDKGVRPDFEAITFQSGSNVWKAWSAWPPKSEGAPRNYYFGADELLTTAKPTSTSNTAFDAYISDPAHPVPYRRRPVQATYGPGSTWSTWLVEDQRFVDDRADVLSYELPVLTEDVTIAGDVTAHLFASTSGGDVDWIVKLIDVYPENNPADWKLAGYQLMVSNEVLRARYRDSRAKPSRVPSDSVVAYTIDLHTQNYTFRKGHRIMVQVQSTWFPLIDRNPQTWVTNIFNARAEDYKPATQRVFRNARYPSHLTVNVVRD